VELHQETLKKMGEKIEITASKWEGDPSIPVIRRMEEFNTTTMKP
jgi:hypothetical protein